jgi:trypsin
MTKVAMHTLLLLNAITVVIVGANQSSRRRSIRINRVLDATNKINDVHLDLVTKPKAVIDDKTYDDSNNNTTEESSDSDDKGPTKDLRVVGGNKVTKGDEYPYLAFPTGSKNCAATLFHDDMLLTAANCGDAFDGGVFLGGTTIDGKGSQRLKVVKSIPHPDFNPDTNENDIMILKLTKPVSNVPKVKLNYNDPSSPKVGELLDVLGYGATSKTQKYSETLQKGRIIVAANDRCQQYRWYNNKTMVCTWFPAGGRDSCDGDAGGPVLLKNTDTQIALVSYGLECGNRDFPSVNTRISAYNPFIRGVMCELSSVKPSGQTCANLSPLNLSPSAPTVVATNPLLGSKDETTTSVANPLLGTP